MCGGPADQWTNNVKRWPAESRGICTKEFGSETMTEQSAAQPLIAGPSAQHAQSCPEATCPAQCCSMSACGKTLALAAAAP